MNRPINEAKLILVGYGGVGKTTLVNRLVRDEFHPDKRDVTWGVEITPWETDLPYGGRVTLRTWDFGGQEIMHATHQFFFTQNTIYMLVLEGRNQQAGMRM